MISNKFLRSILFTAFLLITFSCQDDGGTDCTGALCPFVGNWSLSEVIVDGNEGTGDYGLYRLNLKSPENGNTFADYARTFSDGTEEAGVWMLSNANNVMVLTSNNVEEQYIIAGSGSGHLVLVLNRQDHKPGPSQIEYHFLK